MALFAEQIYVTEQIGGSGIIAEQIYVTEQLRGFCTNSKRYVCIGMWNLCVPMEDSCMESNWSAFDNDLQMNMASIAKMGFNVLLLQPGGQHPLGREGSSIFEQMLQQMELGHEQERFGHIGQGLGRADDLVVRLLVGWMVGESCFRVVCLCVYTMCVCLCLFVCVRLSE